MSASITSGTYPRATRSAPGGLRRVGRLVWQALLQSSARRAQPELLRLAQWKAHSDPALARQLREAARHLMQT